MHTTQTSISLSLSGPKKGMELGRLLARTYLNDPDEFRWIVENHHRDVGVRLLRVVEETEASTSANALAEWLCGQVAAGDDVVAAFVAHALLPELAYKPEALSSVATLVMYLDPHECGAILHDVVSKVLGTTDRWTVSEWRLLARAVDARPLHYSSDTQLRDALSVRLAAVDHDPTSVFVVADALRVEQRPAFRTCGGFNTLLMLMVGEEAACIAPALEVARRYVHRDPLGAVHAPALVKVIESLMDDGCVDFPFVDDMTKTVAPFLALRLAREAPKAPFSATWRLGTCAGVLLPIPCPITGAACVDPVVASDGHIYGREALVSLLVATPHPASPVTGEALSDAVAPLSLAAVRALASHSAS